MSALWMDFTCIHCGYLFTAFNRGTTETAIPICGSCLFASDPGRAALLLADDVVGKDLARRRAEQTEKGN